MKHNRKQNKLKVFFILLVICGVCVYFIIVGNKQDSHAQTKKTIVKEKFLESKGEYYDPEYNPEYITKVNEINLEHEGIKNKYQFVFMADLQASIIDETLEDERLKQALIDRHQEFVIQNPNQIGQEEIFDEIIEYTNQMDPDALLLGGDIIDCPAESNFALLQRELNEKLNVRYLYTLGNHDWSFSWNYHSKETQETYYPRFQEFMDDVKVSYLEYEDLIVLAINNSKERFEEEDIQKVKKVLEKKKPTILMIHVPLSTKWISEEAMRIRNRVSAIGEYGLEPDEASQNMMDLILSDKYDVFYVLAGHVHFAVKDNLNEKVIEEISAPAFQGAINVIKINNQEDEEK